MKSSYNMLYWVFVNLVRWNNKIIKEGEVKENYKTTKCEIRKNKSNLFSNKKLKKMKKCYLVPHTWSKQDSHKDTASSNVWEIESSQTRVDDNMEQLSNSLNSTCKINVVKHQYIGTKNNCLGTAGKIVLPVYFFYFT